MGWSWDHVQDWLTFKRLETLHVHWRKNPPLHKLVAAYLGYEPPASAPGKMADRDWTKDVNDAMRLASSLMEKNTNGFPPSPPPPSPSEKQP